jgi:hypothetical protein
MANEPIIDVDLGQHNGTLKFFSTQKSTISHKMSRIFGLGLIQAL